MIRKFGRLDAPPELVRAIFADAEAWPSWQPGVVTSKVLARTDTTVEVEVDGRFMGQRMHGIFDCRIEPDGFFQHHRTGWLKRWDTRWRITPPPDGRGTTLVCELEIDAGLVGALVPSSFVNRFVDRVFTEAVVNLEARAADLVAVATPAPAATGDSTTLLEIFETPLGYEVLAGGRRIRLAKKD
jgi:ribosome-associated toxin RatA of RatAB toxin-antitoxin module